MVVRRKPTPIGGEVHTMCCAMSGAFVYLELYEGKELMGKAKYNDKHMKSVALTLRMTEHFSGASRVLVARQIRGMAPSHASSRLPSHGLQKSASMGA